LDWEINKDSGVTYHPLIKFSVLRQHFWFCRGGNEEEVFAHSLIEIAFSKALSVGYKDVIIFSLALGVKLTHYNFWVEEHPACNPAWENPVCRAQQIENLFGKTQLLHK